MSGTVRVLVAGHADDAVLADDVRRLASSRGFESVEAVEDAEVVVLLLTRAALRGGLGTAPAAAFAAGVPALGLLVGPGTVPSGFPVPRKHLPVAAGPAEVVAALEAHRAGRGAKIAASKRDLLAHGLLLALARRGATDAAEGG